MDKRELENFTGAIAPVIRGFVDKALAPLGLRIAALEAKAPEKGDKGDPGRDGKDGADAKGEPGEKGDKGDPGEGDPGRDGQPGVPGRDGKDGLNGKDGAAGADGLGFDDLEIVHDGERTISFRLTRLEFTKVFDFTIPCILDRGVHKDGAQYRRGDFVTWDGSGFIAQCDTTGKPEISRDWRLAIKRGRNGRDGKDGKPGERGIQGERGISFDGQRHS